MLPAPAQDAPSFLIWAARDPNEGWLQRMQIIKGWVEEGQAREQVYDVACSDGLAPDPTTHRCPGNGARVNLADCSITRDNAPADLRDVRPASFAGRHGGSDSGAMACRWGGCSTRDPNRAFYYRCMTSRDGLENRCPDGARVNLPVVDCLGRHPSRHRAQSRPARDPPGARLEFAHLVRAVGGPAPPKQKAAHSRPQSGKHCASHSRKLAIMLDTTVASLTNAFPCVSFLY